MKFKNKDKDSVFMTMSNRELSKYPSFKETNVIFEGGIDRTIADGEYKLSVNDSPIKLQITVTEISEGVNKAVGTANNFNFEIIKDRPIRKYDVFRLIVQNWEKVGKVVEMN